jgi:hypothetical protein
MKALKIIGIVVLFLLVAILIAGLVLPKSISIERTEEIEAPVGKVYPEVRYLKNHESWSPWKDYDPNMEVTYEGTDGEVGAVYKWKGNEEVGSGYQEITSLKPNERVDLDLVFISPWESSAKIYFLFNEEENTLVTWGYHEETPLPKNVMMRVMGVEKMLSKEFDKGLSRLKEKVESENT